ncbi:MAG: DpnI domain-containing protein [Oscillospiraceae bacterium]
MNLHFDSNITQISGLHSGSQIARVLTEAWVAENMFCPRCGNVQINSFPNNRPVADFFCPLCKSEYELKSKKGTLGHKSSDGAYETMIQRITGNQNPDFFFMNYSKDYLTGKDLILIPKHFFVPDIIEKRKPLSDSARRAGWVGCNILLDKIPSQGKISIISEGKAKGISAVVNEVKKCCALNVKDIADRGWLMDILNCLNTIRSQQFSLENMYSFEHTLLVKHPKNHNIRPKIRQQMQLLRDRGYIEFLGNGRYRKIV